MGSIGGALEAPLPSTAHSMSQMEKSISTTSIGVSIDPTVSGAPSEIAMESGEILRFRRQAW